MSPLKLAVLSLVRRKFPTFITLIAITLAVACSGVLLRLNRLSESRFSSLGKGGDAIVGAKAGGIEIMLDSLGGEGEFPGFLPYKLFESLRAAEQVRFEDGGTSAPNYLASVIPFVYFAKLHEFRIVGTDETFFKRPSAADSLSLAQGHWANAPGEVVAGASVAEREKLKIGDRIQAAVWTGNESSGATVELTVVGILSPVRSMWDRMLYSTVTEAHAVFQTHESSIRDRSIWGPQVLNYFLIYLKPGGFAPLESLVNRRTVGQVIRVDEQKKRLQELTGAGESVGLFVTVLVIVLGSLSVCSMLVTRFEGMTVQLAVLRAIGYTKKEVAQWLMWEGLILGALGCTFGGLLDLVGLPLLRAELGNALPPSDLVTSSVFESAPVWVVAIAAIVVAVMIPLFRLFKQDVHDSLRGV